jgi:hypothetical protein
MLLEIIGGLRVREELRKGHLCGRKFLFHWVHLFAAEQAPLVNLHIARRYHPDHASGQAAKNN